MLCRMDIDGYTSIEDTYVMYACQKPSCVQPPATSPTCVPSPHRNTASLLHGKTIARTRLFVALIPSLTMAANLRVSTHLSLAFLSSFFMLASSFRVCRRSIEKITVTVTRTLSGRAVMRE